MQTYDQKEKKEQPSLYNPQGEEKLARDWVYTRKHQMEDSQDRQKFLKQAELSLKAWEQIRPARDRDDWQSNHTVPLTLAIVETVLSEVVDQSPRPMILPRGSEDAPKARVMQRTFEYSWDVADGDLELYDVLKDTVILGTAIAQEWYWKEPRKIYNSEGKEETMYDFDDPYMESVYYADFFVDEKARGFGGPHQARDCIRRFVMDFEDFKLQFSGENDQMSNVHFVRPGGQTEYTELFSPPHGFAENDVEVLWYWSRKPKDCLYIVANGVLIAKGPNPYRHKQLPFARAVDIKRPHSFYGKGEPELLESMQDELNILRRQMLDRNHLDIDKGFFVSASMNLTDEDLISRPHMAVPVDDVNAAKAIEYGDTPRSVELGLDHLEDDSVIATGINPRSQSLPSAGTATEAAILKESTLKRIRLKMKLFEKEFLTTIGRLRVSNILQYYSQPKLTKIVGEAADKQYQQQLQEAQSRGNVEKIGGENYVKEFRQIRTENTKFGFDVKGNPKEEQAAGYHFFDLKPEYFVPVARGGYDIKFEAGSTLPVSKALMKQETLDWYDRKMQLAVAVPNIYDLKKIGDELDRAYDKNPADYYSQEIEQGDQRLEMEIELANLENKEVMKWASRDVSEVQPLIDEGNNPVPPLANASPAHTSVHVEFTKSPAFQELPPNSAALAIITDIVSAEVTAQETRAGAGQPGAELAGATGPGGTPAAMAPGLQPKEPSAVAGGANKAMQGAIPGKIQGGGMVSGGKQAS